MIAVLSALLLPHAPSIASQTSGLADDPPIVRFSIPRYTLTRSEQETVAACLILEAASQGEFGMRGVMSVIRNRAQGRPPLFASVALHPKQFSAFDRVTAGRESLARAVQRAQRDHMWDCAVALVNQAVEDAWNDPTQGATHYTRSEEQASWTRRLAKTVTIGAHSFYK